MTGLALTLLIGAGVTIAGFIAGVLTAVISRQPDQARRHVRWAIAGVWAIVIVLSVSWSVIR